MQLAGDRGQRTENRSQKTKGSGQQDDAGTRRNGETGKLYVTSCSVSFGEWVYLIELPRYSVQSFPYNA